MAKRYNEDMAGIDKINQLLGSYDYPHISKSGNRQLFYNSNERNCTG